MGIRLLVASVAPSLLLASACGGHAKKAPEKPVAKKTEDKKPAPPPETEADRERKRHEAAVALIPPGACLPASLREPNAPHLELAAETGDAVLCATDTDKSRLLGPIACWKVDLRAHTLAPQDATPMPGRNVDVFLDDRCARGYCLPADAQLPETRIVHMAWSYDGKQVVVLSGDSLHLFDAAEKKHLLAFSIRGDKGVTPPETTAIHFVSDTVFVEAGDATSSGVWVFHTDGTQVGPITPIGAKETAAPVQTHGGSFSILDKGRVAVTEQGFAQTTIYEIESGKRSKAVRKPLKVPCKPAEIDAFWKDGDKVTDKCREAMVKETTPWVGAAAIAGHTNWLVVLRGERTGELAVVDPRTLAEDKSKLIKLQWCDAAPAAAPAAAAAKD